MRGRVPISVVPIGIPPSLGVPPLGWTWRKLNEIAQLESGHTPSRSRPDWWGGEISWVSLTEIRALDGNWVESTEIRTNEAGIANSSARILPRGTVCFSRTASVGFVTILSKPMATSQDFANWICGDELDPEFLMYALIGARRQLRAIATGATHKTIYMPELKSFYICLPPRDRQEQLVSSIKAQLQPAHQACGAVKAQLENAMILRSRVLAGIFAEVAAASHKAIGDYARTTSGSTPPRGNSRYWKYPDIPWVKTGEVAFVPITSAEESISRSALAECSLTLLPPKTILIAMYGQGKTRGQSAILEIEATTNQACFAILPNDTWDTEFLYYWLFFSYEDLRSLSENRGGNQSNLNGGLLNALKVPAPDRKNQEEIVQRVKAALREVDLIEAACRDRKKDIDVLPTRIIAKAFEG